MVAPALTLAVSDAPGLSGASAAPRLAGMAQSSVYRDPGQVAIGTWSGGRFMHFGEAVDDERFLAMVTPDEQIDTVITADVYGTGDADRMLGRAIAGRPRESMCVVGAVGHDFYEGERNGPKGFPRFTDPGLRRLGSVKRGKPFGPLRSPS